MKASIYAVTRVQKIIWTPMAKNLWPESSYEELERDFTDILLASNKIILMAWDQHQPIGFAYLATRTEPVEGASSYPVGYLEGLYVKASYRRLQVGRNLILEGERWCLQQGCTELASDVALSNNISQQFHLKSGFMEANRIVCYCKKLHSRQDILK